MTFLEQFDHKCFPYASQKTCSYARNGMVATSTQLGSQAGLDILKKGGNAVDAAIATMITNTVVEPTMNNLGSDNFAIVWMNNKMYGLNSSGPAAKNLSIEKVKSDGFTKMPHLGYHAVNVPGAPAGWKALHDRFGSLPFEELFETAIKYAEEGVAVTPQITTDWQWNYNIFMHGLKDPESGLNEKNFEQWRKYYLPNGKIPTPGQIFKNPDVAKALRQMAKSGCDDFYKGDIAKAMVKHAQECGGVLSLEDLAEYKPEWVEPISVNYRGYDVWEIPPNGNGISLLMALNILKGFDLSEGTKETARTYHLMIESMKLGFIDSLNYTTDPRYMKFTPEQMLDENYADERRSLISDSALIPTPGSPEPGGTVYCATADKDGNMVSFIQSNFHGFGSGMVVPGYGFALNNRGSAFSLDSTKANALVGGKKSFHTIIPGFLTKDGKAIGPFGCVGAFIQPQGQMQLLTNTIDFHMNPQAAIDSPRWFWQSGKTVMVESDMPQYIFDELCRMGHDLIKGNYKPNMGRAQIIWRDPETGVLCGATDKRCDGSPACY